MIKVEGLWKHYGLPPEESLGHRLKRYGGALLHGRNAMQAKPRWLKEDSSLWALRDINFEVQRGENLGIIGRNGSGKSTLLKVLAQTSPPTYGKVTVNGRIFSMIELAAGMNLELTGRENVRLLATVMGFSPRWTARRLPEIENFCELEEWFDRPVWKYSSGMMARLGFAVGIHSEAEIYLIDEVLAVGDLAFQRKSYEWFEKNLSNKTVILVSHSLPQIARICSNSIVIEKGQKLFEGEATNGISFYEDMVRARIQSQQTTEKKSTYRATYDFGEVTLVSAELFSKGTLVEKFNSGDEVDMILKIKIHEKFPEMRLTVIIEDIHGIAVVWFRPMISQPCIGLYEIKIHVPEFWLGKGQYFVRIGCSVGEIKRKSFNIQNVINFFVMQESEFDVDSVGFYSPPWSYTFMQFNC